MTVPPPDDDKLSRGVRLLQGLTLGNVLVLAALSIVAVPVFIIWKAVSDEDGKLLNRLLSSYEERPDQTGCLVRHVKERAGPDQWGVSSAFAVSGVDRWFVTVITSHEPLPEEVTGYCATAKLLADRLVDSRRDVDGNISGP